MRKEVPMETGSWIEDALECIGSAAAIALVTLAAWLFCVATPSQVSAEAEMERGVAAAMQDPEGECVKRDGAKQDLHGGAAMRDGVEAWR